MNNAGTACIFTFHTLKYFFSVQQMPYNLVPKTLWDVPRTLAVLVFYIH